MLRSDAKTEACPITRNRVCAAQSGCRASDAIEMPIFAQSPCLPARRSGNCPERSWKWRLSQDCTLRDL